MMVIKVSLKEFADMEKSDTSAGEPEILALVHVIKCPIAVQYRGTDKALFFGEAYQKSADTVHLLIYPDGKKLSRTL